MSKVKLPLLLGALVILGAVGTAAAQTDEERASARAAAQQGISALKAGRYAEAIDFITRAESVVHAPTHLLYLARAHAKLGKLVKARETYLKLTREDLSATAPKAFREAQSEGAKELAAIEPRLAAVTIVLEGQGQAEAQVVADGTPIPRAFIGISQPADPGAHQYRASSDVAESDLVTLNLAPGARETVTLVLGSTGKTKTAATTSAPVDRPAPAKPSADASASGAPKLAETPASSGGPTALRVVSYLSLGVGAVGLGAGGYFLVRASDREEQSAKLYEQCVPRTCTSDEQAQIHDLDEQANSARKSATVGFVVGGVGVAAGLVMFIIDVSRPAPTAGLRMYPWVGAETAGLGGSF
jgi:hypothetical protein